MKAEDILAEFNIGRVLVADGWSADLEQQLRKLHDWLRVNDIDPLKREMLRSLLVEILKAGKIPGASRIADAVIGNGQQKPREEAEDVEPWPDPVDGGELFQMVENLLAKYLVLPPGAREAIAAWILATWAVDVFDTSAFLDVNSPVKQCGKTRVLEVLELLVRRPVPTLSASEAALFRIVDEMRPTVLIDEAESLSGNTERALALRAILNAAHRRGPGVPRCEGDSHEVRYFRVFGFYAFAAIGRVPDTIESRSLIVRMVRKTRAEKVARFRRKVAEREAEPLRRMIARWVSDHLEEIAEAEPELPDFLTDRQQDLWECLFKVAEVVGGDCPAKLREAASKLTGAADESSVAEVLLQDLRELFEKTGRDRMSSREICEHLAKMEERPWGEWRHGKPISPTQLARLLSGFGVTPSTVRVGSSTAKGYKLESFEEIFSRYTPLRNVTTSQPSNDAGFGDFENVTRSEDVTARKTPKPAPALNCDVVTAQNQGVEQKKIREATKRMLWDVVGGRAEGEEGADGAGTAGACSSCGGRSWWKGRSGEIQCWRCHPPSPGVEVVDAWDVEEDEGGGVRAVRWGVI